MAKLKAPVKSKDESKKSGGKKLSPIKTKKGSRTKSSDKISSTSKMSKTISKSNKSSSSVVRIIKVSFAIQSQERKFKNQIHLFFYYTFRLQRKAKEIDWLNGLLDESANQKKKRKLLESGISKI